MGNLCSSNKRDAWEAGTNAEMPHTPGEEEKQNFTRGPVLHSEIVFDVAPTDNPAVLLSCADDKMIKTYNWETGEILETWAGHTKCVNSVVYAQEAKLIVSGSRDKTARVWKHGDPNPVHTCTGHTLNVAAVDVNTDNTQFCSGSRDYSVRFWDMETGESILERTAQRNVVTDLKWVPWEDAVVQTGEDLTIRVWDTRSGAVVQDFKGDTYFALSCDVSPDGNYILTSCNGFSGVGCEVKVWDRRAGKLLSALQGHTEAASSCLFVPPATDGHSLCLSASKDQSIKIWDITAEECVYTTMMEAPQEAVSALTVTCLGITPSPVTEKPRLYAGCVAGFVGVWEVEHGLITPSSASLTPLTFTSAPT